ncbi:hypothetical protein D3C71_1593720 [compost metagenome]
MNRQAFEQHEIAAIDLTVSRRHLQHQRNRHLLQHPSLTQKIHLKHPLNLRKHRIQPFDQQRICGPGFCLPAGFELLQLAMNTFQHPADEPVLVRIIGEALPRLH